ncbi:MAG: hypothetical protein GW855_03040 [Erythrobacter sp.]|nr:hypothetical protein [Erythrobacter sp.]NCQ65141.1 hypothetical protein [Alphaproteobacteria bacterium]
MFALALAVLLSAQAPADEGHQPESSESLDCSYGGFDREFGGTRWIVFGCSDRQTIVIATAKNNPGGPFYFIRYPKDGGFSLAGEGTGDKAYTKAAFEQLKAMSDAQWSRVLSEVNAAPKIES